MHHVFSVLNLDQDKMAKKYSYLLLLGILFCYYSMQAQTTININPVKDNTLYEDLSGSLSNGAGSHFFVGSTNLGLKRRGLIQFDITSNVPPDATILEAILTLSMDQTVSVPSNIELHNVSSDWGEGVSVAAENGGFGAASQANDATWLHSFYSNSFWKNAGGDFSNIVSATTSVGGTGKYTWTSTQLIADVQNWLDSPALNFGWCLTGDETIPRTAKRFASREISPVLDSPRLTIVYTITNGVHNPIADSRCIFYPNPSTGKIQLMLHNVDNAEVKVFNILGRMVYISAWIDDKLDIDLSKESKGIYFYELLSNKQIVEKGKFIINR